jgi:hypothetical protein
VLGTKEAGDLVPVQAGGLFLSDDARKAYNVALGIRVLRG